MKTLVHKNITEGVVEYLKQNILNNTWAPGDKISSENELTERLQVSRASVRYAIQHLVAIGVLESFQGKGTFVKAMPVSDIEQRLKSLYSNADMEQLLEFRIMVEGESCRLAAARMTEEKLNRLKVCLVNMMNSVSDREAFIREDMAFHQEILKATGNHLIVQSMECINSEIEVQHHMFNTEDKMATAIEYHRNILMELEKGNGEQAARYMASHLANVKDYKGTERLETEKTCRTS